MSSSSSAVTIAAIAAGCSLLAYGASHLAKSPQQPKDLTDLDDEIDAEDCISPDDVVAIFDKLFMTMQQVVLQLTQQVQQIQMAGQSIPEKQLRQLLKGEFVRALGSCQTQVFEDADVDADCLEQATWEFMESPEEYPKVKRAVERFQKLYDSMSGEDTFGWTPNKAKNSDGKDGTVAKKDMTPEELIKAATIYFEEITKCMVSTHKSWKEAGKNFSDPQVAKQFQLEASTDANEIGEEKMTSEMGIAMGDFRSAIDKYARDPAVGQVLGMLQMQQQQQLMAAGVPMT
mmetsp:Transcript_34327/g.63300  ORF Transcript_34327/g.63300 Transcript_34327/m.63300 type:complete len:288 (-) Transcript_34327:181-1044(-)|eukprot:CAMPEP_0196135314 /NCGR_PEP_ID=MMETSP0910-20130528/3995_1 /TAXON_ID=49265 /ORGANISM="Thalassiosira rotula, Strain GSO102" /LENGTH=287 /DNA_ID=CAMNT_0041395435 /DNA_START=84 /DNA_END=947 /DNA_ORIENTATION=-